MFKLLNTLSWVASFSFWFVFCVLIWMLFEGYRVFDDDLFLSWIFFIFVLWAVIKKMFFSSEFIENSLLEIKWLKPFKVNKFDEKELEKKTSKESVFKREIKSPVIEDKKLAKESDSQYEISEQEGHEIVSDDIAEVKDQKPAQEKRKSLEKPWFMKKFFSENLLAKLWAILLFLWVLFFLWLIYNAIWPVWKLIIWFTVGFLIFFIWVVLDKKWLKAESRILLWTWVLINYLVILSWRYLIWDAHWLILKEGTCFLFLLMNTIFAIITSLLYKSNSLLWFSFFFAYINPLLVWASHDSPYSYLIYWITVSFWALWLAYAYKDKAYSKFLIYLAFIAWNILFLLAACTSNMWWISKILFSGILCLSSIFVSYNKWYKEMLFQLFWWAYLVLILHIIFSTWALYWWILSLISYSLYMILMWAWSILLFFSAWITGLLYLLILPLFIFTWLILSSSLVHIIPILIWVVVTYMCLFALLFDHLSAFVKYWLFTLIWIFVFITSSYFSINAAVTFGQWLSVFITSFIFLICSYYFSSKKWLEYLFSLWSLWTVFMLLPVISTNLPLYNLSVIWLILFFIINSVTPVINKNLTQSHIKNMVIWSVTWILFIWFEIYHFLDASNQWLMMMWYYYFSLAIYYFVISTRYYFQISDKLSWEIRANIINAFYCYIWICISLFSLAIALVFSKHTWVVSIVWLLESSLLFYFYQKTNDTKIYLASIILMFIWIIKLCTLYFISWASWMLPVSFFTLVCLALNLIFTKSAESDNNVIHDLLHLCWIYLVWYFLLWSINIAGSDMMITSSYFLVLSVFYSKYSTSVIKFVYLFWLLLLSLLYILEIANDYNFGIIDYLSTFIFALWAYVYNKFSKYSNAYIAMIIMSFYLMISTTMYVDDIFDNVFIISMYWWAIAFISLYSWIQNNLKKYRTIWLYILVLTLWKILLLDIWYNIDEAIFRVFALMLVWTLMIIISSMYSKRYWWNLKWEFNLKNLESENQ